MRRSIDSRIKKRIVATTAAVAMMASVVGTALYMNGTEAYAYRSTLAGIENIVDSHSSGSESGLSPFVILEVVPNLGDARLGFLVGGEEPVYDGRSIKEMPSKDEREHELQGADFSAGYLAGYAYDWTAGYEEGDDDTYTSSMDIRGEFKTGMSNWVYYKSGSSSEDFMVYDKDGDPSTFTSDERDEANADGTVLYRKMESYTEDFAGGATNKLELERIDDSDDMPISLTSDIWNWQFFTASDRDSYESFSDGDIIYQGTDNLTYIAMVDSNDYDDTTDPDHPVRTITDVDGNKLIINYDPGAGTTSINPSSSGSGIGTVDLTNAYKAVTEANSSSSPLYKISSVSGSGGVYRRSEDYSQIPGDPSSYSDSNCPVAPDDKGPYYWTQNGISSPYAYDTTNGSYTFMADYTKEIYQSFKYKNGFTNHELFKKWVLDIDDDEDPASMCIDVIPVTLDMLDDDYLEKADLVYFSGSSAGATGGYGSQPLDADVALSFVNKVANDNLPVMMEYSTYTTTTDDNLMKLALCLMQKDIESVEDAGAWGLLDTNDLANPDNLWFGIKEPLNEDISYAKGTVFVNDDLIAGNGAIVGDKFYEEYTRDKVDYGFSSAKAEIENECVVLEQAGKLNDFNQRISKATSIRYILNANNSRIAVKNKLKILDIEPLQSNHYSDNELKTNINERGTIWTGDPVINLTRDIITNDWVRQYIATNVDGSSTASIDIKQIGTREFIGVNEDLNASYDMIYIGMDTALMNTTMSTDNNVRPKTKLDNTIYNDSSLDGLVYFHMGDTINNYNNARDGKDARTAILSGNDITQDKLRELTDYIKAGYAVVISDGFLNDDDSINTTKVDESSNMYKLIKSVVLAKDGDGAYKYYHKNVHKRSDVEGNETYRDIFKRYVNISKLNIEVISQPVAYNPDRTYIAMNSDGTYSMDFEVKLTNDSAVDASSTTYDCKLYLDMDSDGKFEEGESLGGLNINNGGDVETDGKFHLRTGNTYTIKRLVPDDYVGFLSWKLAFIQNEKQTSDSSSDANSVRSAISGFSAVPHTGEKPIIEVLQLVPNNGNNLDLKSQYIQQLCNQVDDFDINVTQISVMNFLLKYGLPDNGHLKSYYEFLSGYDMVVMGFTDMYEFVNPRISSTRSDDGYDLSQAMATWAKGENRWIGRREVYRDAALAIREYALSGRSILFTHDLSSFTEVEDTHDSENPAWGYYANIYWRDIQGMDRFGELDGTLTDITYTNDSDSVLPNYESKYDYAARKGSDISEKKAFTDGNILRFGSGSLGIGATTRWATRSYNANTIDETVTAINEGQITQYPYLITTGTGGLDANSSFNVSGTHAQYFQLNLDTDSTDSNENDDVVVWYVISNNDPDSYTENSNHRFYRAYHNDARNNYYIFNKGNVTYTGAGHSAVTAEEESKLFVNTLVAAYNSGLHAPKVAYKENPWEQSTTIKSTYVPYDPELVLSETSDNTGGFLDDTITINFKTLNNNFRTSKGSLYTEYYCELPTAAGATFTCNGQYFKKITPTSFGIVDATGAIVPAGSAELTNYRIYQAKFNLSDLTVSNGAGKLSKDNVAIYVRIGMEPLDTSPSLNALPATESLNKLDVFATKLFDLE